MIKREWIISILTGVIFCLLATQAQANIILKTMVVNPSATKTQTALLKAYLPKEVKPEDIIELGDLKLDYDIEKGLYYVYQKYELKPGESVSREIEIKDVWVISKEEIEALNNRAKELAEKLKGTIYFNTAITLQKNIESKGNEILDRQEEAIDATPRIHIGAYRSNIKVFDSTNTALMKLEKMIMEAKPEKSPPERERIHVKSTWRLIIAMVIILGLISFVFFVIWNRQASIESARQKAGSEDKNR